MIKALYQRLIMTAAVALTGVCVTGCSAPDTQYPSVRGERKSIEAGNALYADKDYEGALGEYTKALQANGTSPEALFNASCARMRMSEGLVSSDKATADSLAGMAEQGFMMVSTMRDRASSLASAALYNLGNKEFRANEFQKAIGYYIQSLRINPDFNEARRNLRIAQLKQQQNQDQNKDQNKDKDQDKDQDKQDKNKDQQQNQDKNQDKNKDKNQDKNKQQQQQQERLPQQAADRILEANQRQEEATRARLQMRNKQRQQAGQPVSRKKW